MVRQGFKAYQMQGVEFYQLGQGGRIGHYPVHFHMVRSTPNNTFVKDCSIHDSMTRWITLHATDGVLLARNVGYMSIGHGYYIEDGTETNNKLYSNIGILARAAVDNVQNPRKVPGILSAAFNESSAQLPVSLRFGDADGVLDHERVERLPVQLRRGRGSLRRLLLARAGVQQRERKHALVLQRCDRRVRLGVPERRGLQAAEAAARLHLRPVLEDGLEGLRVDAEQPRRAGTTPLMNFVGNTCTTAMNSFQTVGEFNACNGVGPLTSATDTEHLVPITNTLAPTPQGNLDLEVYYPRVVAGASRPATRCGPNPKQVPKLDCGNDAMFLKCGANGPPPLPPPENRQTANCMATVLDRYTSSYTWADTNFAAIWLRQFWFVLSNSAITDVQNGGLTFVTGGDYTRSSVIDGVWSVAAKSAFVGRTQKDVSEDPGANPYAADVGPFNPKSGLQCPINDLANLPNHCIVAEDGVDFEVANFATNQRLFSIYDGPSYQDSNAYLDIVPTRLTDLGAQCHPSQSNACPEAMKLYGRLGGMPKDANNSCYLPNAAIGWKQPNGFFYPPAFHSQNLFFDKADIRHFVIQPEFVQGTFKTDPARVAARYCTYPTPADPSFGLFNGFTDVDRQTVLNDDDGSLTGLIGTPPGKNGKPTARETISVNYDGYFDAPIEDVECASDVSNPPANFPPGTAKTSPYEYLTTAVYPACARINGPKLPETGPACGYRLPTDPVTPEPLQNPNWWSDCTTGTCYGVPLYRQGLISGESSDATQAIRMMGGNLWQRSTLTANNGVYYVDTASGPVKQMASPFKNIFEASRTYYLLFVYATPTTHQVYQLWLGPGLPIDYPDTNVFLTRAFPGAAISSSPTIT